MPVPSSTKPTTISLRKQSASTVKLRNRRRAIKRLVITAPKTRSYRVRNQWKKYKTNGCANYDILWTIFGQAVATGEQQLEEELRARGPVLGSGVGLDSTIDLDDISMTPSTQGGVSQRMPPRRRRRDAAGPSFSPELSVAIQTLAATSKQRADLDAKMFELCSSKRSRGEG
ncbi:uncharacterized protein LOC121261420 isoform X1 [Juglans microcarpa x Juglans regia]|uniref:uncharacterized protein LOC121261420 isoform X1 n=1 Tax=Juglans microcarpa x Juglans regia TaxID=2249226 RepID=UPI001B7E8708|nr:uncharacterized protein LOC121261420 isoform X1 [Juglans microcarpa x Juglans regia]XP_041019717.1 uncharacterized protein LOC121261420 isoform X1 [Juglans microcarpa x Juglans regia]